MQDKKDFFISYNSADKSWAEWIAWHLEAEGFETIIQAWDFHPGSNFVLDMQRAASMCKRTVAVLSSNYLEALYTQPEWAAAFVQDPTGAKGTLLPVRVQDCELEGILSGIVYIDLVGITERDAIKKLVSGASGQRTKPDRAPGFPGQDRPKFPISTSLSTLHEKINLEIVLTYSSKDVDRARAIREEMGKYGISVWRDQEQIKVGAEFDIEIEQAIRRADAVIALITDNAGESEWVRNEIEYAKYAKKLILPLLLDQEAPPIINIMSLQHIPFHDDWNSGITALTKRLRQLENEKATLENSLVQSQANSPFQPSVERGASDENPFLYGGAVPVEFFVGRKAALRMIQDRVGNSSILQSLSVVSNRRMGKTSLLNYVWKKYDILFPQNAQYATVFIDVMDARAQTIAGVMRILRRGISRQLQRAIWSESDDGKLNVLSEAFEELAEYDDVRLVLLLDEWESVMAYPELDSLLYTLRSSGSRGWVGMITATAHLLSDLQEKGGLVSHFYNIFSTLYLDNLEQDEWKRIIQNGFERSKYTLESQEYELIGALAGGHPYLTQLAGSLLWQAKRDKWDTNQIKTNFAREARMIFTDLWQRLSLDQIQAIKFALSLGQVDAAPENVLSDLQLRGTLTKDGDIFCKPFADFILQELR